MDTDHKPQRYTAKVRRGFARILDMDLRACVDMHIQRRTGPGLRRADKLTAPQVAELRAACDWLAQEATKGARTEVGV